MVVPPTTFYKMEQLTSSITVAHYQFGNYLIKVIKWISGKVMDGQLPECLLLC